MTPADIAKLEAPPNCNRFMRDKDGLLFQIQDGRWMYVESLGKRTQEDCACVALQYWRTEELKAGSYELWSAAKDQIELFSAFGGFAK